jgi:hypothetical protein
MTAPVGPMPSSPFPSPASPMLKFIVNNAIESVRSGEATLEAAILHATVHGWYEGHIEGEDVCQGCDFRGNQPKQRQPRNPWHR